MYYRLPHRTPAPTVVLERGGGSGLNAEIKVQRNPQAGRRPGGQREDKLGK